MKSKRVKGYLAMMGLAMMMAEGQTHEAGKAIQKPKREPEKLPEPSKPYNGPKKLSRKQRKKKRK